MNEKYGFLKSPVFFTDRKKISDFAKIIEKLPQNSAIIIREYDLDQKDREIFAQKIINLKGDRPIKIIVGKDIDLARKINADGIHFSDFDNLPTNFRKGHFLLSFATHQEESIAQAINLEADMIFISPVFASSSHLEIKPLNQEKLRKILLKYKDLDYIYALGGINKNNISTAKQLGFSGFGAIDFFNNL